MHDRRGPRGVAQGVAWAILHGHVLVILHASLGPILVLNGLGLLVIVSYAAGLFVTGRPARA